MLIEFTSLDAQVNMSDVLAQQFHMAMLDIYDRASKLKPPYRASRFKIMVNQEGSKAAADKLLASNKVSDGFTELFLRGKDNLRISVEYLVLEPQSLELFTADQLAVATKRLVEVGCPLPAGKQHFQELKPGSYRHLQPIARLFPHQANPCVFTPHLHSLKIGKMDCTPAVIRFDSFTGWTKICL